MAGWPSQSIPTGHFDEGQDDPALALPDLLELVRSVNKIIAARDSEGGVAPLDNALKIPIGNLPIGPGPLQLAVGNHRHDSRYQPLSDSLTAIAAASSAVSSILQGASFQDIRTRLGLGSAALADYSEFSPIGHTHPGQGLSGTAFGLGLLDLPNALVARLSLGLGSAALADYSEFSPIGHTHTGILPDALPAPLSAIGVLSPAANRIPYYTSTNAAALAPLSAFGRSLLSAEDLSGLLTLSGLGTAAAQPATAFAPTEHQHEFADITGWPGGAFLQGWLSAPHASAARSLLSLGSASLAQYDEFALRSHTHPRDYAFSELLNLPPSVSALAALTPATNQLPYFSSASAAATTPLAPFGRGLLGLSDLAAWRAYLGLGSAALAQYGDFALSAHKHGVEDLMVPGNFLGGVFACTSASQLRTVLELGSASQMDMEILSADRSWSIGTILNGAQQAGPTISLYGAKVGDFVTATASIPLQGCRLWAEVTADSTIVPYISNTTGASVALSAAKIYVRVDKRVPFAPAQTTPTQPTNTVIAPRFSTVVGKSPSSPLDGATLTGNAYIFVPSDPLLTKVEFWLDAGNPSNPSEAVYRTENTAPWDLLGSQPSSTDPVPLDTTSLGNGAHTLSIRITYNGAVQAVYYASFSVSNTVSAQTSWPSGMNLGTQKNSDYFTAFDAWRGRASNASTVNGIGFSLNDLAFAPGGTVRGWNYFGTSYWPALSWYTGLMNIQVAPAGIVSGMFDRDGSYIILSTTQALYDTQMINAAAGANDAAWYQIGISYATVGRNAANTILNPGHEFNGTWYPWNPKNLSVATWTSMIQRAVTNFRNGYKSVLPNGNPPRIGWCYATNPDYAKGGNQAVNNVWDYYPGDAYTDVIVVHHYDNRTWNDNNFSSWTSFRPWHNSMAAAIDYCVSKKNSGGPKIFFGEWCIANALNGGTGTSIERIYPGQDNVTYINMMYDAFTYCQQQGIMAGESLFQDYSSNAGKNLYPQVNNGTHATNINASNRYKLLWGA